MKMMTYTLLNHIQGKNGSEWAKFIKENKPENLLIVAIDAAKYTHKGLICNFFGDVLVKPFDFDASSTGYDLLMKKIKDEVKKLNLTKVVVGIETTGHYYEDIVRCCHKNEFKVRVINAATTAQERQALLNWSKTDNLDLMAIVQSILHGRGTSNELPSGNVETLQKLTRSRRTLVDERTKIQNGIRVHIDHVFREFQGKSVWIDGKREHVKPFSELFGKAACYLLRHYPHPSDILALGAKGLREISKRENLKIRDHSIDILLDYARTSISRPKEELKADLFLLSIKLDQLLQINEQIKAIQDLIEEIFVETEGAVLLSVQGIGVITGAELYAEMGNISDFDHAGQLIKMAGTNPIVKQSGGRKATYYGISKQGRRTFRNIVYQVGKSMTVNNYEMKQKYEELKARGKHFGQSCIALGNRMLRLAFSMIRNQTLYRSKQPNYVLYSEIKKKMRKKNVEKFFHNYFSDENIAKQSA